MMKKTGIWMMALLMAGVLRAGAAENMIVMSTTTSTQASGLLDVLLPAFLEDTGIHVRVMAKGTGAALRDGMDGNADILFVHDRAREDRFVAEGYGTRRYGVMYNDFILVGPEKDTICRQADSIVKAMEGIAQARQPFVSRGDDSGTHAREKALWQESSVPLLPDGTPEQGRSWYYSIGQGMGEALMFAQEKEGYVLSDRGTYLQYAFGRKEGYDLTIVYEGDEKLKNSYGVIPVNPERFPHVRWNHADTFARWLVSDRGQAVIGGYQLHGQPLFFPDAKQQ
ncbi:substrate-binding domain-containing protein [Desulfobotulus sp. H1]|uniref:Substrate-binding domain-containing protein n=1 Tax=Desulfobotulus pelophilus TaxID=2823377 RepID=A0ABT3N7A7_9BACT|nr:substrate-binding domain-containing protein [Desulfobotulus pelophilus]MCW7753335.1 substrate-binding domain-containing protein [Desulfobotulus pelophilus]